MPCPTFLRVSRRARANHAAPIAARKCLPYRHLSQITNCHLELPATHHPHSAAVAPPNHIHWQWRLGGACPIVRGPGIPAWVFPSAVQGHYAAKRPSEPTASISTSTSRCAQSRSPPSSSSLWPPRRQGRYQISHMQRITDRREGSRLNMGPEQSVFCWPDWF